MGKHFRIVEGGRSLRKDGLNEPQRFRPVKEPRYWPAAPQRSTRRRTNGGGFGADGYAGMLPLTISLAAAVFWGVWTWTAPEATPVSIGSPVASSADTENASFGFCHTGGGTNCVVDGDTIYYQGTKIRIADIDTPETHDAQCTAEQARGDAATQRLIALVNAGPFSLQRVDRDEDRYGRKLRVVTRGGESLGGVLVDEGLARWYEGGRRSWC